MIMLSDNPFNEKQTLQQLSQGSETAFEKIYNFYSQRLYSKVLRLVKSDVIAEEILQDVFLVIWDNRSNIDPEKSFCSYLFCIATNKCYDYFRKTNRDARLKTEFLGFFATEYSHIEELLINKNNTEILNQAINSLPRKRRQIFMLCKFDGKSYTEVSQQLGISLSTISDHIVKANRFIKTLVDNNTMSGNYG